MNLNQILNEINSIDLAQGFMVVFQLNTLNSQCENALMGGIISTDDYHMLKQMLEEMLQKI